MFIFLAGDPKSGLKVFGPYQTKTEARYENAARGRSGTVFPIHDVPVGIPANYCGGSICVGIDEDTGQFFFVGCFDDGEYSARHYAKGRNMIALDIEFEEREPPTLNDGEPMPVAA